MKQPFLDPNDPRLSQIASPLPLNRLMSDQTTRDIQRLYAIARPEQADRRKRVLVGLAAPQVGMMRRIILIDGAADGHGATGELRTYLNPAIIDHSADTYDWYEGCFSTAPACGIVARARHITLQAYTPDGRFVTEHYDGYVARVIQHEIDHLNGRIFLDHIANDEHLHWVEPEDYPEYRDREGWRDWPRKYPRQLWCQRRSKPLGQPLTTPLRKPDTTPAP